MIGNWPSWDALPVVAPCPMPGTASSTLLRNRAYLAAIVDDDRDPVVLRQRRGDPLVPGVDDPSAGGMVRIWEQVQLTTRRVHAPAPYVGEPFGYSWRVAIDPKSGMFVAGDEVRMFRDVHEEVRMIRDGALAYIAAVVRTLDARAAGAS